MCQILGLGGLLVKISSMSSSISGAGSYPESSYLLLSGVLDIRLTTPGVGLLEVSRRTGSSYLLDTKVKSWWASTSFCNLENKIKSCYNLNKSRGKSQYKSQCALSRQQVFLTLGSKYSRVSAAEVGITLIK